LDALEQFWEDELPRVGEELATGWANEVASKIVSRPKMASLQEGLLKSRLVGLGDPFTRWALDERIAERRMPTRSSDVIDGDPYCTVLFADIRNLVMNLTAPKAKFALKRIWLCSLGLHIPGLSCFLESEYGNVSLDKDFWSRTQLRRHSFFESVFPVMCERPSYKAHAGVIIGPEVARVPGFGPIKEWGYNTQDPLEGIDIAGLFRMWEAQDVEGVDVPTLRNIFSQLREHSDLEWDLLEMAFEAAVDPKR
jgi:NRDE-2, necessary for RNA interference